MTDPKVLSDGQVELLRGLYSDAYMAQPQSEIRFGDPDVLGNVRDELLKLVGRGFVATKRFKPGQPTCFYRTRAADTLIATLDAQSEKGREGGAAALLRELLDASGPVKIPMAGQPTGAIDRWASAMVAADEYLATTHPTDSEGGGLQRSLEAMLDGKADDEMIPVHDVWVAIQRAEKDYGATEPEVPAPGGSVVLVPTDLLKEVLGAGYSLKQRTRFRAWSSAPGGNQTADRFTAAFKKLSALYDALPPGGTACSPVDETPNLSGEAATEPESGGGVLSLSGPAAITTQPEGDEAMAAGPYKAKHQSAPNDDIWFVIGPNFYANTRNENASRQVAYELNRLAANSNSPDPEAGGHQFFCVCGQLLEPGTHTCPNGRTVTVHEAPKGEGNPND